VAIASGLARPGSLVALGDNVYVLQQDGTIVSVPKKGGPAQAFYAFRPWRGGCWRPTGGICFSRRRICISVFRWMITPAAKVEARADRGVKKRP